MRFWNDVMKTFVARGGEVRSKIMPRVPTTMGVQVGFVAKAFVLERAENLALLVMNALKASAHHCRARARQVFVRRAPPVMPIKTRAPKMRKVVRRWVVR